ncbi:GNAT family N-acetyltransferase [Neolewinella aurantiaca]|uniref:GNAT family N-acetyltransferase n=1 Tax=Neolewinella aurantiaca TaxID=2602767 RepID=A0A5C7FLC9_9BACT|nr:GNAT family N-acetyltransferase [Neolewinella aurantiaca]TXF90811.1 GNAT family N-acetyltransferase [Neolewinella aurantiaca]
MNVTNLSATPINKVIECFLLAFESYFASMPTDHSYYIDRWKAAGVDFELSYGMFDGNNLIAFIIHAVGTRAGTRIAFNTGTGVIPEYRGRRIVKTIYEFALKDLLGKGIERSTLEVITRNNKAIKAYQSVGFRITRRYSCFSGQVQVESKERQELKEIPLSAVNWEDLPNQPFYSWDFQKETILQRDYRFYQVIHEGSAESFFVYSPETQYLAQFDLLNTEKIGWEGRKPDSSSTLSQPPHTTALGRSNRDNLVCARWERLFHAIRQVADFVKVINVDERLEDKISVINSSGLVATVEQYEMEMELNGTPDFNQ